MTRSLIARRAFAALLAATTLLLTACGGGGGGGGGSDGNATWRALNVTVDLPSVDVYADSTRSFPAAATDVLTDSQQIGSGSHTLKVNVAGGTNTLLSGSYSLGKDQHYTAVVWGRNGSLRLSTLPEDEDAGTIATGNARVRVFNATGESGSYDLHLTQNQDELGGSTVAVAAAVSGTPTAYRELPAGTYRLRVTPNGDTTKVRLDIPAVTLTEKQVNTIIVTPGTGGVLVNGGQLVQRGAYTPLKNPKARLRVVPGADANGLVSVQLDGQTLVAALPSPPVVVPSYATVTAGDRVVNVLINGTTVSTATRTLAPGGDYTLLVYGSASAGHAPLLVDDNRVPATGRYKARLVNGASSDPLNLTIDSSTVITDVALGTSSAYVTLTVPTTQPFPVVVSSLTLALPEFQVSVQSQGVYSVFVLGGNPAPTIVRVKEP